MIRGIYVNIVGLIVLILLVFACKSKDESSEFFKRGVYHFKKNEIDKALLFFTEAIKKDPTFADPLLNRGIIYQNAGDLQAAENDFNKAIALDGNFHEAKFQIAKLYALTNRLDKSDQLLKIIENKYTKSSDYYTLVGQNMAVQNDFTNAEINLKKALELNQKNPTALTNLGYIKLTQRSDSEAEKLFKDAIKIDANFTYAQNNLGVLAIRNLKFNDAIGHLKKVVELEPKNQIFLNNLCLAYLETKDLPNAKEIYNRSQIIDENNPYCKRNKAILGIIENKNSEAETLLLNIDKTHPEVEYLYYYLAQFYQKTKNSTRACYYYNLTKKINDPWLKRLKIAC